MKSGTTSLYSYIARHPNICECRTKEPNFFIGKAEGETSAEEYEKLWDYDDSMHRYVLEGSTGYTKYPQKKGVPEKISASGIKPKFLYILRNPFERIESHYNAGRFNPEWKHSIMDDHLINTSNYYMQLQRFRRYFPRDSFLLLDFDQMKTDPEKVLRKIFDFLQLEYLFLSGSYHRKNKTVYKTRWELVYKNFIRAFGVHRIIPESVKKLGRKVHSRSTPIKRRLLDEEERKRVFHLLEQDMINLRDEYDVEVGKWGFGISGRL